MVRVAAVIAGIGADTRRALARRDPGAIAAPGDLDRVVCGTVPSPVPGVLVSVNRRRLVSLAAERDCVLRLAVRIGDYLPEGATLFAICGDDAQQAQGDERRRRAWQAALCRHVAFETERTMEQDAAFGFRQLADVALQALSPAVNAPTTAAQAIEEMHDLLRRLVISPSPGDCYRDGSGKPRLLVPHYQLDDFLQLAVAEIWHNGRTSPQIPERLRRMLDDLRAVARPEHRAAIEAWREQVS